jgi:hypothetical protein
VPTLTYDCSFVVCLSRCVQFIWYILFSRIFASWDEGLGQSTRMEEREGRNRTIPPRGYIVFCTLGTAGPGLGALWFIIQYNIRPSSHFLLSGTASASFSTNSQVSFSWS